jgi:hypothetical protein
VRVRAAGLVEVWPATPRDEPVDAPVSTSPAHGTETTTG